MKFVNYYFKNLRKNIAKNVFKIYTHGTLTEGDDVVQLSSLTTCRNEELYCAEPTPSVGISRESLLNGKEQYI